MAMTYRTGSSGDRRIIEMPLSSYRVLLMVYLTEHPAISARLAELGWRVYPAQ